jgi:uncharacterized membrane protein (DUF106 family)
VSEWAVVGVIVVLVGLVATIVKPMITLTKTLTELTVLVRECQTAVNELTAKSHKTHEDIYDKLDAHGNQIRDHEYRLQTIEKQEQSHNL